MNAKAFIIASLIILAGLTAYVFKAQILPDQYASSLTPEEQYNQGVMYENGWGRARDREEAARWYLLAAQQDYTEAQFRLAGLYYSGKGFPQDYRKALQWYERAAANGHVEAEYQLGWMYYHGEGVDTDREEADKWFSRAREQGFDKAAPKAG
jgi:TPR repeat protein